MQSVVTQPPVELGCMGVRSGGVLEHLARVVRAQVLEHKYRKPADHIRNRLCLALDLQLLVSALIRPDPPLLLPKFDRAFRQLVPLYPSSSSKTLYILMLLSMKIYAQVIKVPPCTVFFFPRTSNNDSHPDTLTLVQSFFPQT
jgi:hypothetical protein